MSPANQFQPFVLNTSRSPHAHLRPVPLSSVTLRDEFWEPRRAINREATLFSQFERLEESGCLDNFRRAAGQKDGEFRGPVFMDSDAYKWLEAASSSLATHREPKLETMVDAVISLIAGAQQPDGYLNTHFMLDKAPLRWTNLRDWHEMYCAGHLIQAGVAHFRATGSSVLLDVVCRVADNLCDKFGRGEGQVLGTDGHPEIEMALVELGRTTNESRYLEQAEFFTAMRGRIPSAVTRDGSSNFGNDSNRYCQDHVPYRDLDEVTGHAVRMIYLACGATDLFHETGDASLKSAIEKQWQNMTERRMYVSGGLGSRYEGEAFGKDFELPGERAYTETCAAIAGVMWNYRLLSIDGDARYGDLLEWMLFNAVLPGLSLDGQHYYYQNPLADDGTHRREGWFGCACCPPNVARMLSQLPGYFYSHSQEGVWVHLYAQNSATVSLPSGQSVHLEVETRYPWDGDISLRVEGEIEGKWSLFLRIPGWCESGATLEVNGQTQDLPLIPGTYLNLHREWQKGDTVRLHLPMPVQQVRCHPFVSENGGRAAVVRGPLLFCLEGVDHPNVDVRDVTLSPDALLSPIAHQGFSNGIMALSGEGVLGEATTIWSEHLYRRGRGDRSASQSSQIVPLTFTPYYAWANRQAGQMIVWVQETGAE